MSFVVKDGNGTNQNLPGYDATYGYGGIAFTPVATPTMWLLVAGAASKYIRLKRLRISGFCTTIGSLIMVLAKGSDLGTAGSGVLTAVTATPFDSANATAAATVSTVGTANYTTVPTLVGSMIRGGRLVMDLEAMTIAPTTELVWDFSTRMDQAPILTTALECFYVTCQGDGLPTGAKIDWELQLEQSTVA
jgi:hypothetical protein